MGAKTVIDLFDQDELEKIRRKASSQGDIAQNPMWKRAYFRLADDANYLRFLIEGCIEKSK